jgi:hypothetical protein
MNIIFYCTGKERYCDNFSSLIASYSRQKRVEIYKDIGTLSHKIKQPHRNKTVAVICAETFEDLVDIYMIKHLFSRVAFILILPDNEKDTLAMGSLLRPLFTFSIGSNISDINTALQRLMAREHPDNNKNHSSCRQENQARSSLKPFLQAA